MSDISSLLTSLYANDHVVSMEKTAEDALLASLQGDGQAGHSPFASLSDEELQAILNDEDFEKGASADASLLEKTAAEMLGGQVMAHAMVHEMGLMKVAMIDGLCRVCKADPMDLQGSSVCSGCLSTAE